MLLLLFFFLPLTNNFAPLKAAALAGASVCSACVAGQYRATTGGLACTSCAAGKANANTGEAAASSCADCAAGRLTNRIAREFLIG
jgi:hypothetical protein